MKPLVLICRHKIMRDCWQENLDERSTYEKCRNNLKEMEHQHQVETSKCKCKLRALGLFGWFWSPVCSEKGLSTYSSTITRSTRIRIDLFFKKRLGGISGLSLREKRWLVRQHVPSPEGRTEKLTDKTNKQTLAILQSDLHFKSKSWYQPMCHWSLCLDSISNYSSYSLCF